MAKIAHFVGLDVHKESITIAAAAAGSRRSPVEKGTIPNDRSKLMKKLDKLGPRETTFCCYEAGPTGYGLWRYLESVGVRCSVVAPTLIPRKPGERVKTDRRDASKLARFLRSGDLTSVWVPDAGTEALRDLVRAREAAKADQRAARHRLGKFLLRHDRRYAGRTAWTGLHLKWIRKQKFEHLAQDRVLRHYLHVVEEVGNAIAHLDREIEVLVGDSSLQPLVHALQALKGVRLITAATIAVELGDLTRFENPRHLMSFVGLVASEHSTGENRNRRGITKTGNSRVRRVLVEAAWSYRYPPRTSLALSKRTEGLAPELTAIGWSAQQRLHRRYRRLLARGKRPQVAITAIARELAGFVWSLGQRVQLPAT